jgi:hypothetical protein
MDYNLVSKNNIGGVVGTLILAIFLSQSRSIDFLFRTVLGRLTLIVLILAMSYTNKILGVVGVLFVVIIFSSTNIEGLDNMETTVITTDTTVPNTDTTTDTTIPDTTSTDEATGTDAKGTNTIVKKDKKGNSVSGTPIDEAQTGVTETETEDITTADASGNVDTTENAAVEGFDIIGLERNIQKGKDSNKIPVNHNNDMDNILPGDFSKIGFSLF